MSGYAESPPGAEEPVPERGTRPLNVASFVDADVKVGRRAGVLWLLW